MLNMVGNMCVGCANRAVNALDVWVLGGWLYLNPKREWFSFWLTSRYLLERFTITWMSYLVAIIVSSIKKNASPQRCYCHRIGLANGEKPKIKKKKNIIEDILLWSSFEVPFLFPVFVRSCSFCNRRMWHTGRRQEAFASNFSVLIGTVF